MNVLRCRPPDNRTPLTDEAANCRETSTPNCRYPAPIRLLPRSLAAQALLGDDRKSAGSRQESSRCDGMRIICTYHPAYLLRNPAAKRDVWEDIQVLMKEMGLG